MTDQNFYAERGGGELQRFLQDKRTELHSLDVQLQQAHDTLEAAEIRWMEVYDATLDDLEEDLQRGTISKLPGEDVRIAIARRSNREAWSNWRRAERAVKKLEKRATLIANQISAAQSEAKLGGVV